MKNILSFLLISFIHISGFSQVFINVEEANEESSADLQIDSNNSGFGVPEVMLTSPASYSPILSEPKPGLIVYNSNITNEIDPGLYVWVAEPAPAHWELLGSLEQTGTIIQNIDEEFLGYDPVGAGLSAPDIFSLSGGGTATKERCVKWEIADGGNGHAYCAYTANQDKDFNSIVSSVRDQNGYVVTIVSTAEWNFVKDNVINDGLGLGGSVLSSNIWLGYVKLDTPGNGFRYHWMTGETWENNWSNNAAVQSYFASGEPQPATTSQITRCTFIQSASASTDRLWSSQSCTADLNMNNIIVEFNQ